MPRHSFTPPVPRFALFFALLGLAWCAYISFPAEVQAPCATSGCELFRSTKLVGISLWWIGGAFFFALAAICLRGRSFLAARLLALGIFLDAILLIIMFFTAPCLDCLIVAACMGLCLLSLQLSRDGGIPPKKGYTILLSIWFGLLLANGVLAANENIPPYIIEGEDSTEIRLFFSPSCPACREAIKTMGSKAALYPVEEQDGDFEAILRLEALLKDPNIPYEEALRKCQDPLAPVPEITFLRSLELRIQLLRNKAAVFRQGFRALPLIEINGMPGFVPAEKNIPQPAAPVPAVPPAGQRQSEALRPVPNSSMEDIPDFLDGLDNLGQCGQGSAIPCE